MRYVALLRAINVGGNRSLPMASVREVFAGAGATDVTTYIQSGNVVFTHAAKAASLCAKLAAALEKTAGFAVPVVLRTEAEWTAAIAANPYPKSDSVHCGFLPAAPATPAATKLAGIDREGCLPSKFEVIGREVYLELPDGIGRDKLAAAVFRALPDATVRNWRTVQKLAELLSR